MTEERVPDLREWLAQRIAERLGIDAEMIGTDRPFQEFGLSSRDAVAISGELESLLGRKLRPTLLWERPTIDALVEGLTQGDEPAPVPAARRPEPEEAVAVVGLGCRFPGARGPELFWDLLREGEQGVRTVPEGRWDDFHGDVDVLDRLPRSGGYLDDVAAFDAEFFEISPKEAEVMDPQQRLLLEVAWEALEHAGMAPSTLRGTTTGVFVGVSAAEYGHLTTSDLRSVDAWTGTGAALSIIANRLSYFLDLRGPSIVVDTACSSSLVAIHQACASLRGGESRTALAGGVNVLLSPAITANFQQAGALAADGKCKAFDASADGIVRGEGCGVVVLKRLSDAHRDGDRVLAVIRGSAVNSDGRSNGLMAPNPASQTELLRNAYASADLDPSIVDYVEAHGTGTLLGDPIEAEALGAVLGAGRARSRPLLLGSVKTNLGHLEAAAGIAGVIKVVQAMRHGELPPSLHYTKPNPHIPFEQARLEVVDESRTWPKYSGVPRAGVSGFGFGGTNAHVVLEAWPRTPARRDPADAERVHYFAVSGVTEDRMRRTAADLADWMATPEGNACSLEDIGYTLAQRRSQHEHRAAVVARGRTELIDRLRALAEGGGTHARAGRRDKGSRDKGSVWVFSGYGGQWPGMCRTLLADEPAFASAVAELDPEFQRQCGFSLTEALSSQDDFTDVGRTQRILFGVQVALAALWRSYGVEPAAVIGHSMGEVSAAVVAGALTFADGLRVMVARSALLVEVASAGADAMAAIESSPDEVVELEKWFPGVTVAVRTSPLRCTVAGPADEVRRLIRHQERHGRMAKDLGVSGAGHTSAVDPVLDRLRGDLTGLTAEEPTIPVYSTVEPGRAPEFDADYWVRNLRSPVSFDQAVRAAAEDGFDTFVEISPHPVAVAGIEESVPGGDPVVVFTSRRDTDDTESFHTNLAHLHVTGRAPAARYTRGRIVDLPLPAWDHRRHWIARRAATVPGGHPLLGIRVDLPDGGHAWRGDVGTDALPWLADHRVQDSAVLPGTAYLEMALAAAGQAWGLDGTKLRVVDLQLHRFLSLDANVAVTTTLAFTGARAVRVEVHTRALTGKWTCHASANVEQCDAEIPAVSTPVEGDPVELYAALRAAGQDYGPAFCGVEAVRAGNGHAFAEIRLPGEAGSTGRFDLHPALVDACLQTLFAASGRLGQESLPVPVEFGAVRLLAPMPGEVRCHAQLAPSEDEFTGSVLVTDVDNTPVLEIGSVRASAWAAVPEPISEAFLETRWVDAEVPAATGKSGSWVVLGDDELAESLRAAGHEVLPDESRIPTRGVVVSVRSTGPADIGRTQRTILRISHLVRGLPSDSTPRLWILSGEHSWGLRALVRVLAFEHPELRATIVRSETPPFAELLGDSDEDEVMWLGERRRVARLAKAEVRAVQPEHVVRPGAYVISGGLGGLGTTVARWLVERGASRVVLNGRSAPSEPAARLLAEFPQLEVVTGDLAEEGVAQRLVEHATRDGMCLHGVVHAAGVLRDGPFAQLAESSLDDVWRPKVWGAWRLHEATEHLDLDWWVAFSSSAGLLGSPGQSAYATANAWVDDLVRYRRERRLPGTTIQWGVWSEVGGAGDALAGAIDSITPADGLEALEAVLASDQGVTGVARFDPKRAAAYFPGLAKVPFFGEVLAQEPTTESGFDLASLREKEPAEAVSALTNRLVTELAAILGCGPEHVDPGTPLTMLGMDSLMAMRARNAVERDFGVPIPATLLLRGGSISDIGQHLGTELGLDKARESVRVVGPRDATERWLAHLWRQVLGRDTVSVDEDFFAGGGAEALAEKVTAQVNERLGTEIEVAELFAVATIERMADLVRERFEVGDGPVRVLREGSARTPLFLFHPAGGPTSVYQPLVRHLAEEQPCYGMDRIDEVPLLEDKATRYIELLKAIQPHGPYRLGGWSFGGVLAYETAQQLTAAGEQVDLVVLIDTILPLHSEQSQREVNLERFHRFVEHIENTYGYPLNLPMDELDQLSEDEQMDRVMTALGADELGIGAGVLKHQHTSYVDARIAERYRPRPYDGRVVLYRAQEAEATTTTLDPRYLRDDESLGWDEVASWLEVVRIPGNHLSMIDPPHVDQMAIHLAGVLDSVVQATR